MGSASEFRDATLTYHSGETMNHTYRSVKALPSAFSSVMETEQDENAQLERKIQHQAAELHTQADEIEWGAHYRALLEAKLEEAGMSPPRVPLGDAGGKKQPTRRQQTKQRDKGSRHQPSFMVSAIAQSKKEARNVKDMLAKMEKRALAAEERASEAVAMERKARAALDAREKQMGSMRIRLDKISENVESSEAQRRELQEYVDKLERKLRGRSVGPLGKGATLSHNSSGKDKLYTESLLEELAELQNENGRLNNALQEVEEALESEAKLLSLADGGALLESLRTRRLLETTEISLKKEKVARKQSEIMLKQAEVRATRAEEERDLRTKAEDSLLARCEEAERDNQALLDYVQELTSKTVEPHAKQSSQAEMDQLKVTNEQLVKSYQEAQEKAAKLQWQLERESSIGAEDTARMSALESIIDDLVSIMSKTLGVNGVSKGYQHASIDAMIFATQVLVTKLHAELRESIEDSDKLREVREALGNTQTELRVYKMKCERLVDELDNERGKSPDRRIGPSGSPNTSRSTEKHSQLPKHSENAKSSTSKVVFASRIDRIAALKKRLGLSAASPRMKPKDLKGYNSDSSEDK